MQGWFVLHDLQGNEVKSGPFEFVQQIARFAYWPDPTATAPQPNEAWLVTQTGQVALFWGPDDDHEWHGKLRLFLNDSVEFDPQSPVQPLVAIQYHYDPNTSPIESLKRQNRKQTFGPLPVIVALSGHNQSSGGTFGLDKQQAQIESAHPKFSAPTDTAAMLRPSIYVDLSVWGQGANVATIVFQLTINALWGHADT
jgi:hypothetical protein